MWVLVALFVLCLSTVNGALTNSGTLSLTLVNSTYGTLSTITAPNIGANLEISGGLPLKAFTIPVSSGWVTVGNYTGSGVLKRVWFASAGDKTKLFITINFDNATVAQFGTQNPQPPVNPGSMNFDQLFTCSFAVACLYNAGVFKLKADAVQGSGGIVGAYMDIAMPFSSSFIINLWNTDSSNTQTVWTNFYVSVEPVTTPLRLFGKQVNIQSPAYPNEYPLISVTSTTGVVLKTVKMIMVGGALNWIEGRVKIYCGPVQMTTSINQNHYNDTANQRVTPCVLSSCTTGQLGRMISWSTGWEDYFLSAFSCNFGVGLPNTDEHGGCMYYAKDGSNNPLNAVALRIYEDASAPKCAANEYLTLTYSAGDINGGASGSLEEELEEDELGEEDEDEGEDEGEDEDELGEEDEDEDEGEDEDEDEDEDEGEDEEDEDEDEEDENRLLLLTDESMELVIKGEDEKAEDERDDVYPLPEDDEEEGRATSPPESTTPELIYTIPQPGKFNSTDVSSETIRVNTDTSAARATLHNITKDDAQETRTCE